MQEKLCLFEELTWNVAAVLGKKISIWKCGYEYIFQNDFKKFWLFSLCYCLTFAFFVVYHCLWHSTSSSCMLLYVLPQQPWWPAGYCYRHWRPAGWVSRRRDSPSHISGTLRWRKLILGNIVGLGVKVCNVMVWPQFDLGAVPLSSKTLSGPYIGNRNLD